MTRTSCETVARSFRKRGIDVKAGVQLQGHTPDPSGRGTVILFGDGEKLAVDAVVVSVGRRPRTEGLLARAPAWSSTTAGFVEADATMRTAAAGRVGGRATWWPTRPSSPTWGSPRGSW